MQSGPTNGTLKLTITGATLTNDQETFGSMDPYCKVEYGNSSFDTHIHEGGGENPEWNKLFNLQIHNIKDYIKFSVWDKESFKSDDHVGTFSCQVYTLLGPQMTGETKSYQLFHEG